MEFDWFGIDIEGDLAVFSSVNHGPIPSVVRNSFESYVQVQTFIQQLSFSSAATVVTTRRGNNTGWINYAKQGLYAYDLQDVHRKNKLNIYDIIAVPAIPIKLAQIPSAVLQGLPIIQDKFGVDLAFQVIPQ